VKETAMNRTRLSLFYLAGYLLAGGAALLLAPKETMQFLLSNGDYGDVFPRVAGMFATGLGLSILGMIRARSEAQYPTTLMVRAYFMICLAAFYWMSRDPLFLVVLVVVAAGFVLTFSAYLIDGNRAANSAVKGKAGVP
jgi:hypothetical protein